MEFGYSVLEKKARGAVSKEGTGVRGQSDERDLREGGLFCAFCGNPITRRDDKIEVNGADEHTFANPGGHIFHIGCFRTAPGCMVGLHETGEFTWFAGHVWSAAVCGRCQSHLGWRFRGEGDIFFGLIMGRLVEKARPGD